MNNAESPKSDELKFQICMGKPVIGLGAIGISIHETLRCHPFTEFSEVQKKIAVIASDDNKVRFRNGNPTNSTGSLAERFSAMLPAQRRFQFTSMTSEEGVKAGDDAFTVCALSQSVLKSADEYFQSNRVYGNQHPMIKVQCLKWQTAGGILEKLTATKSSSFIEVSDYPIVPIAEWAYYPPALPAPKLVVPPVAALPVAPYAADNAYNNWWTPGFTFPDYPFLYDLYGYQIPYGGAPYFGYWNAAAW